MNILLTETYSFDLNQEQVNMIKFLAEGNFIWSNQDNDDLLDSISDLLRDCDINGNGKYRLSNRGEKIYKKILEMEK